MPPRRRVEAGHHSRCTIRYAVFRRIAERPDYWDYATLLELEVLAKREESAMSALADALASVRETWEPETTANNIRLIRTVRAKRNELQPWISNIEEALFSRAAAGIARSTC